MTYEKYHCWIVNNYPIMGTGPVMDLLVRSVAGGTTIMCTYPLDLAQTKLAYQVIGGTIGLDNTLRYACVQPYKGVTNVFSKVYKQVGLRDLYCRVGPTLFEILPYAGLKFYVYEELKSHVPIEYHKSIAMKLAYGALARLLGQTFTYPLDVARQQIQV
eukprot:Gb_01189 [translate_table: standard]